VKITDVQVDGFGVWQDLSVGDLSDRMTLFFGRNEAGKTTLMQFIRTVYYGFSPDRRLRYLAPVNTSLAGGSLYLKSTHGELELQRHVKLKSKEQGPGSVAITAADGKVHGQGLLNTLLSGIDEATFNNVFALGLRELQELGTLDDTAAAELLYKLTSGMDRVSLIDVMQQLRSARESLINPEGQGQVTDLVQQRDKLGRRVTELAAGNRRWFQLATERAAAERQLAELESKSSHLEQQARTVEVALQVYEFWQTKLRLEDELAALGAPKDLDEQALQQLDELNERIASRDERLQRFKIQREHLKEEGESLSINRALWSRSCRVDALCEHGSWIASLESQIEALEKDIGQLEQEVETRCGPLRLSSDDGIDQLANISPRALDVLRTPARKAMRTRRRLKEATAELEESRLEVERLEQELSAELAERGFSDVSGSIASAGERVKLLRQRLQLEERIDKLTRAREELKEDVDELLGRQILPVWQLMLLGIPFVLGFVMILLGIFMPAVSAVGWPVAILGFGGACVAVVVKILLERNAASDLDECSDQLERIRKQLKEVQQARDELDEKLPSGGGQLDSRLETAEVDLKKLEDILPLDSSLQAARQRCEGFELRAGQAEEASTSSRKLWRRALKAVNLPEQLSPKMVRDLASGSEEVIQLRQRLVDRKNELNHRQQELFAITERIASLSDEAGLELESDDPQTALRQLHRALEEQRQLVERRRTLGKKYKDLKREYQEQARSREKLIRRRRAFFARAGVSDQHQLRQLVQKQERIRQLHRERGEASDKIRALTARKVDEEEVLAELEGNSHPQLQARWEQLVSDGESLQLEAGQLHEKRGQWAAEMSLLAESRELTEVRFDLECVQQQLDDAVRRWKVFAVLGQWLEVVCKLYEQQRQPETLLEASRFLKKLTEGHYTRVWTPLSEHALRVDNADGEQLPVEVLSRGTREAVFLSLRLALAAGYARRGINLPLVLDDVLVNFDAERAGAAARVLRDFAKDGHQLLMFTCHRHIMQLFKGIKVEVRELPNRFGHERLTSVVIDEPEEEIEEEVDEAEEEFEEELVEEPVAEEVEELAEEDVAEEFEEEVVEYEIDDVAGDVEAEEEVEAELETEDWEEPIEEEARPVASLVWDSPDQLWDEESVDAA
jgi:uncharacterized protein YhaN